MHLPSSPKIFSGAAVTIITLIIATPFCGLMFACGCTWPWSGLDAPCNFHQTGVVHQCPWCVSLAAGVLSLALAMLGGVLTAILPSMPQTIRRKPDKIAARTLFGVTAFLLLAMLGAVLAAAWQDYPFGIGNYINLGNSY